MRCRVCKSALLATVVAAVVLTGCDRDLPIASAGGSTNNNGTNNNGSGSGKPIYSVGGTIVGLSQSGLTLTAANNMLTVAAGATAFTLPNMFATGANYSVTVSSQPQGQTCSVSNGDGTATANVTDVKVTCTINTYTIGGTITGLSASGLVLANGSDTLSVSTGSSAFVLPTKVAGGTSYAVVVQVQPTGLNCQVINGSAVMPFAAVTNVMVVCGQWSWIGGSNTIGAAATGNNPGARTPAVSWFDHSGNLWLFGGAGASGKLNDLWEYSPGSGTWTWKSGSNVPNATGMYGTQNLEAGGNTPGARVMATGWVDRDGNLWLFGGQGYDSVGSTGSLNDLWKYDINAAEWTWENGSATAFATGATPPTTAPGGRTGAVSWTDGAGDLWLFGGMGTQGLTADLWEYPVGGSQWTLVNGSQTANTLGTYGTEGKTAATNLPGSRTQAVATVDAAGNLWLFGGSGYASLGSSGLLNDLWKFTPSAGTSGEWTWMAGHNTVNPAGVYGTQSTTDIKQPGARAAATAARDTAGNLWLFGGTGYGASGSSGSLSDLWQYNLGLGQWIWMGGSQGTGATGVYGTQGVAAVANAPGARSAAISWMDGSGNFWLFGGQGVDSSGATGLLNDLWQFAP